MMGCLVEVARAPGVNRRRSAHKTATHISVDLVIVLFRVDVTCHTTRVTVTHHNVLLYINSVHCLYNRTALDQLPLSSQVVHSTQQVSWSSSSSTYIGIASTCLSPKASLKYALTNFQTQTMVTHNRCGICIAPSWAQP